VPTRKGGSRRKRRTARPVRDAAARAVDRVLSSKESFALLIRRLEEAGWQIERPLLRSEPVSPSEVLTPRERAR